MRKAFSTSAAIPVAAMVALGLMLAGCGGGARNEAAEASETVGGDTNAMAEGVSDVDAALQSAEKAYDNSVQGASGNAVAPAATPTAASAGSETDAD